MGEDGKEEKRVKDVVRVPATYDQIGLFAQMSSLPERLKALLANLDLSCRVDQHHQEQRDMSRHWAGLRVMYLHSVLLADLRAFDIDEIDVVGSRV